MIKGKTFLLLVVILIIASFLRLYQLTTIPPGLYPDEAMNGNNAVEALLSNPPNGGFKVYYPENNGREGLFIAIQAFFLVVLTPFVGNFEPWMLRLPSAIFGILTVLGIYFLAKELFSKKAGLLSAFLLATSFWHINFSRIGFRAIMAPLLLVWATYLLLLAIRKSEEKKSAAYILPTIVGGIIYGLGFYTYIAYRVSPLLLLLFIPFFRHAKNFWKIVGIYITATVVVALPIGMYYLAHPADFLGRTSQVSVFSSPSPLADLGLNIAKTAGMFFFVGDGNWRHNLAGRPELFLPVGICFALGIMLLIAKMALHFRPVTIDKLNLGTTHEPHAVLHNTETPNSSLQNCNGVRSKKHEMFAPLFLFAWLALTALPVVISNEGIPHALRAILMIPPIFILAAYGGIWLYQFLQKYARPVTTESSNLQTVRTKLLPAKRNFVDIFKHGCNGVNAFWLPLATGIILSLLVLEAYTTYFVLWAGDKNTQGAFSANYVAMGNMLNSLPNELPKYVVVKTGGVLVRGMPMPTQTIMFITDTYLPQNQEIKNIHYVLPADENKIPPGAFKIYLE